MPFLALVVACHRGASPPDDTGPAPDDSGTATTAVCVDGSPTAPSEWSGTCDGPLCAPERLARPVVTTTPLACVTALGNPCAGQTDEGGYFYRLVQADGLDLELAFLPALATDFTLDGVRANLGLVDLYRLPLGEPVQPDLQGFVATWWDSADALTGLALDGTRLTATLAFPATEARVDYADLEPDGVCTAPPPEDDIVVDCTCTYTGFTTEVRLDLDLDLVRPDGA